MYSGVRREGNILLTIVITFIKTKLSWIFKSFNNATAPATASDTTDTTATANAANKTWNFKSFSRNA